MLPTIPAAQKTNPGTSLLQQQRGRKAPPIEKPVKARIFEGGSVSGGGGGGISGKKKRAHPQEQIRMSAIIAEKQKEARLAEILEEQHRRDLGKLTGRIGGKEATGATASGAVQSARLPPIDHGEGATVEIGRPSRVGKLHDGKVHPSPPQQVNPMGVDTSLPRKISIPNASPTARGVPSLGPGHSVDAGFSSPALLQPPLKMTELPQVMSFAQRLHAEDKVGASRIDRVVAPATMIPSQLHSVEPQPFPIQLGGKNQKRNQAQQEGADFDGQFQIRKFPRETDGLKDPTNLRAEVLGVAKSMDYIRQQMDQCDPDDNFNGSFATNMTGLTRSGMEDLEGTWTTSASLLQQVAVMASTPRGAKNRESDADMSHGHKLLDRLQRHVGKDLSTVQLGLNEASRIVFSFCRPLSHLLTALCDLVEVTHECVEKLHTESYQQIARIDARRKKIEDDLHKLEGKYQVLNEAAEVQAVLAEDLRRKRILARLQEGRDRFLEKNAVKFAVVDQETLTRIDKAPAKVINYTYDAQRKPGTWDNERVKHPVLKSDVAVDCSDLWFALKLEEGDDHLKPHSTMKNAGTSNPAVAGSNNVGSNKGSRRAVTLPPEGNAFPQKPTTADSSSRPTTALAEHLALLAAGGGVSSTEVKAKPKKNKKVVTITSQGFQTDPPPELADTGMDTDPGMSKADTQSIGTMTLVQTTSRRLSTGYGVVSAGGGSMNAAMEASDMRMNRSVTFNQSGANFDNPNNDKIGPMGLFDPSSPSGQAQQQRVPTQRRAVQPQGSEHRIALMSMDKLPAELEEFVEPTANVRELEWLNATISELWIYNQLSMSVAAHHQTREAKSAATTPIMPSLEPPVSGIPTPENPSLGSDLNVWISPKSLRVNFIKYFKQKFGFNASSWASDFVASCQQWVSHSQRCYAFVQMTELCAACSVPINKCYTSTFAATIYSDAFLFVMDQTSKGPGGQQNIGKRKFDEGSLRVPLGEIDEIIQYAMNIVSHHGDTSIQKTKKREEGFLAASQRREKESEDFDWTGPASVHRQTDRVIEHLLSQWEGDEIHVDELFVQMVERTKFHEE